MSEQATVTDAEVDAALDVYYSAWRLITQEERRAAMRAAILAAISAGPKLKDDPFEYRPQKGWGSWTCSFL